MFRRSMLQTRNLELGTFDGWSKVSFEVFHLLGRISQSSTIPSWIRFIITCYYD